jgi:glycine hydroxymethyltransferase
VNAQGLIDYDQVRDLALQHRPKMIVAGYSCYTGSVDWALFRSIADEVGAIFLADIAHVSGLVASKLYLSPIPFAHVVTSTTHKTLRGPRGGVIMAQDPVHAKLIDSAIFPGIQGGPLMHVIAGKAVCFKEAMSEGFIAYQKQVLLNAKHLSRCLLEKNISLSGPMTENHIVVVDLSQTGITGAQVQGYADQAGISLNKNTIPQDRLPPTQTSGVRLGTQAITTRGLKEDHMPQVASWLEACIFSQGHEDVLSRTKAQIEHFLEDYPLFVDSK